MFWTRVKAGATVLYRAFIAGAIGGAAPVLASSGAHAAGKAIAYAAIGGGIAAVAVVLEQWFDPRQESFGVGSGLRARWRARRLQARV
jgi:hypothetical protein